MPVARIIGGIGRVLITAGLVILLFVGYQLWGTGLAEARAQDELRDDFAAALATTTSTTPPTTAPGAPPTTGEAEEADEPSSPTTAAEPVAVARPEGEAVALIRVPSAGIDKAVVAGVTADALKKGPGHYPGTPMPGQPGNSAIAGHRTTYGAPFGELGSVERGDEIVVTTRDGEFRYLVDRISVVSPSQVEVLAPTGEARITLTTCHPRYSARQRLIVSGVLAGEALPDPAPEDRADPEDPADPEVGGGDDGEEGSAGAVPTGDGAPPEPATAQALSSIDDPSLAGDPAARLPAAGWAAATGAVALAGWVLGRRWRRAPAYLLAAPVGAVTLFQCFEQVARLLPANM